MTSHGGSIILSSASISSSCSTLQLFRHGMKRFVHLPPLPLAVVASSSITTTTATTTLPNNLAVPTTNTIVRPKQSIHGHIVMNTFHSQTTSRTLRHELTCRRIRFSSSTTSRLFSIHRGGGGYSNDDRACGSSGTRSSSSISSSISSSSSSSSSSMAEYVTDTYQTVYVAVGSNMGDRFGNIMAALAKLEESSVGDSTTLSSPPPSSDDDHPLIQNIHTSFLRETPPMYLTNQPPFLNAVLQLQTKLSPHALLKRLKQIERQLGRDILKGVRNGPRPVDLDILVYGGEGDGEGNNEGGTIVHTEVLQIPHPRMGEREFVLEPLCDLKRGLVVPGSGSDGGGGRTAEEILHALFAVAVGGVSDSDADTTVHSLNDSATTTTTTTAITETPPPQPSAVLVLPLPRNRMLSLNTTVIMGILNTTPDSFSDGGKYNTSLDLAVEHALRMVEEGAGIIDIGGESTRPGAVDVELELELERVIPVIRRVREVSDIPISIDTRNASVAKAAILAGADIINDVSGGLHDPFMLPTVAQLQVPIILMHMRGTPQTMQSFTKYDDVVEDVANSLLERSKAAEEVGIPRWLQVMDPGIGFAKDLEENLSLLRGVMMGGGIRDDGGILDRFPMLLGPSRKGFIGKLIGESDPERRDFGTVAACILCSLGGGGSSGRTLGIGGTILRVHNVKAVKDASVIMEAILNAK